MESSRNGYSRLRGSVSVERVDDAVFVMLDGTKVARKAGDRWIALRQGFTVDETSAGIELRLKGTKVHSR
jgi:hypothetical protein